MRRRRVRIGGVLGKLLKNGMHGILAVHIFLFSGKNKVKFTFFRKWTDGQ